MIHYASPLHLKTEQYHRIHEELRLIGPGPAAFYQDACRIMEADPPFEAATHLISHSLRELESALRDVLRPVAAHLLPSDFLLTSTAQGGTRQHKHAGDEKDGHTQDIRQILSALAIPETDRVAQQWLQLAPKREEQYGFASRAHRNNLAEPRPLDDTFRQLWRDMNAILERVLDAFKARYLTTHHLIDTRLVHGTDSLTNRMEFLTQHIPQNPVTLTYFFTRIGEQQAIEWLSPLSKAGYFRMPPPPDYNAETKTTRYTLWPASQYLMQVAALSPQQVLEILLDIPWTENVRVYEDCVQAACQMLPAIVQHLVPRVIDWLQLPYQGLLPDRAGALIDHLARGEEREAAMQLSAAFLDRYADLGQPYDLWNYARILGQTLPSLVTTAGLRMLMLLADRLAKSLPADESDVAISFRQVAIEDAGDERFAEMGGLSHLLISLVRQAAMLAIEQQQVPMKEILTVLQAYPSLIFTRLRLYVLSRFPDLATEAVAGALTDLQLFARAEVRHEYVLLLQAAFGNLASADQQTILAWIEQGPGAIAAAKGGHHEPFTHELEAHHVQQWQRDWYARFGHALPAALQPGYEALVEACGPAMLAGPSFPWASTRWGTMVSPKSGEELRAMKVRELVTFLKTWRPKQPDDPLQPPPSAQALYETLKNAAAASPQHFSRYARQFRALPPNALVAILAGLVQALKQQQAIHWPGTLDMCLSVARKRASWTRSGHIRMRPQWKDASWQVLELLTLGCMEASSTLPLSLHERVWAVLHLLTRDSDPTPEEERPFDTQRADLLNYAETTIRCKALFGVLAYAEWIVRLSDQEGAGRETREQPEMRETLSVEVETVLDEHLDVSSEPSVAVHSFYGQAIPRLQVLAPAWVEQHRGRIFPRGEDARQRRQAAWDAYCTFWRPGTMLLALLAEDYRYAIDELEASPQSRVSAFDPDGQLVYHLILLACQGVNDPREAGGLLDYFFSKAPLALRRLFWEEIGLDLARAQQPLPPGSVARLQGLWDWRIATLSRESQQGEVETGELTPFRWWFKSGKFPAEWSLQQLETTLRLHGTVDAPLTLAERLAELSRTHPLPALRCLALLVQWSRDVWKSNEWTQQVSAILEHALSTGISEARPLASEVIHRLGVQGEDYRHML